MGQTDGRTPDSYIDPAPHTMRTVLRAVPKMNFVRFLVDIQTEYHTRKPLVSSCNILIRIMAYFC